MTPFLRQVARHYYTNGAGSDISRLCFVFPNRRALRFFEHYLGQEIAACGHGPVVSPQLFTVNDFFYHAVGARPSDRISLLLELYGCYKTLNTAAEPLDDFLFWGDTLLGDFDDVDKYLVNPEHLFTNVSDFKSMQDDYSYLSEDQREAILRFVGHFQQSGSIKEGFLSIWRILLPLYRNFNTALDKKGLCYEGKVYRRLVRQLVDSSASDLMQQRFPWSERFVFVGLNALSECEKEVLRRLHRAGVCEFCWDYVSPLLRDKDNKSSFFLKDFLLEFPSAFQPDAEGLPKTEFCTLSVPGSIVQAKQLPRILSLCTDNPGIETAVVLPDEQMLIPVLNSIPEHVSKMNVTMGYPIGGSQMWSLINELGALQLHLRQKDGEWYFYHRQVWALASNSIVKSVLSPEGKQALDAIRAERRFYVSQKAFGTDPVLKLIFRPVVRNAQADKEQVREICSWMQEVLVALAVRIKGVEGMQLELDFAKVCHETLGGLLKHELELQPASLFRLLGQLMGSITVPFTGEPLEGMQIMGPLELRAMDFKNLIILNCNEGIFPRHSVSASFIPPELRKGFGLPSHEYQDAVWAYYFYRAVQRASRVWMVFDSRTDAFRGGEPSRYIKQLEMHFGVPVKHYEATSLLGRGKEELEIPKTADDLAVLHGGELSASAIKNYLACPVKFYYAKVQGLKAEKEVSESLDASMLGNVLHKTMQELLPKETRLDAAALDRMIKDKARIRALVDGFICQELKTFELGGRNLVYSDVLCSYVDAIFKTDKERLPDGTVLKVIDVEKRVVQEISGFRFVGFIDRLDSPAPGQLRVVDYKSGRVEADDLFFNPKKPDIPEIGLQLYLYKRLLASPDKVTGAIYHPASLVSGAPLMELPLDTQYCDAMDAAVDGVLTEISDLALPWKRTEDTAKCKYCDFRAICGR